MKIDTIAVHGGYQPDPTTKAVAVPINSEDDTLFNRIAYGSEHPGGANFGLGDGAVTFISETVDFGVLLSTASRDGNEPNTYQQ